jgi:glycosyltransferase involved in cell wall biosynthesis
MIGDLYASYKGLSVALTALRHLRAKGVDLHLHVLGKGPTARWIAQAASLGVADLLHLDGMLSSGTAVNQWLDRLDLYIQPSFTEGLPRGLVEAMSRGLPALASDVGGIPELLPAACLHRPGDHHRLAQDLQRMLSDPGLRVAMTERNFSFAQRYQPINLEERRREFWNAFTSYVREKNGRA